jgi:hypothetical protein
MNEDLHKMDDLFRSGLEGKEDTPSPATWENIERELDKKEHRPAAGFYWRKVAAVLLIIFGSAVLFAAGYFAGGGFKRSNREMPLDIPSLPRSIDGPAADSISASINKQRSTEDAITASFADKTNSQPSSPAVATENIAPGKEDTSPLKGNAKEAVPSAGKPVPSRTRTADMPSFQEQPLLQAELTAETTLPLMVHEPATVDQDLQRQNITPPSKLFTAKSPISRPVESATPASSIPVANKRSGSLNLPALSITPMVAFQSNANKVTDDGSRWGNEMKQGINQTEHSPSRISGGLLVDLRIARNISLQSGLILTQRDVHIDPKSVRAVKDIDGKMRYRFDCSAGTYFLNPKQGIYPRPGDTAMTKFSSNSLNYLNIPLAVKWHFGNSKLQFFATAGAGLNLLTSQELEAALDNSYPYGGGRVTNLKNNFFNGMIGAGINYSLNEKLGLNFSPQYQFALTPMNENMPVKAMPRSFNLQLGLQLKLK